MVVIHESNKSSSGYQSHNALKRHGSVGTLVVSAMISLPPVVIPPVTLPSTEVKPVSEARAK